MIYRVRGGSNLPARPFLIFGKIYLFVISEIGQDAPLLTSHHTKDKNSRFKNIVFEANKKYYPKYSGSNIFVVVA